MLEKDHYARFESCTVVFIVYASCLKLENDSSLTFSSWCKSTHMFRLPVRAVSHVALWEVILSLRVIWCQLGSSDLAHFVGHQPLFVKRGIFYRKKCSLSAFLICYIDAAHCRYCWRDLRSRPVSKLFEILFLRSLKRYSQRLYAYFREGWRHLFYKCFKTWTSYYFKYGRPTKVIYG